MAKANKDFYEKLGIKIGPYDIADQRLKRTVRVVVAYKEVKNSVNSKGDIEYQKNLLMNLVNIGILRHIYGINDDVNEKYDLHKVIPLKIPIVVWGYDQLAYLFARVVSLLF